MASELALEPHRDGVVLKLRAAPGARREGIVGVHGDALKIAVQAPPDRGRANRRILELLARALGVPPRSLMLLTGETTRDKRVLIADLPLPALRDRVAELLRT